MQNDAMGDKKPCDLMTRAAIPRGHFFIFSMKAEISPICLQGPTGGHYFTRLGLKELFGEQQLEYNIITWSVNLYSGRQSSRPIGL